MNTKIKRNAYNKTKIISGGKYNDKRNTYLRGSFL